MVHQTLHHVRVTSLVRVLSLLTLRTQTISLCLPWAAGSSLVSPAHHLSQKEEETELIYDGEKKKIKDEQQKKGCKAAGCYPERHRMFPLKLFCLLCTKCGEQLGHSYEMFTKAFVKTEFWSF